NSEYGKKRFVAYNGDLILEDDSDFNFHKSLVVSMGYQSTLRQASLLPTIRQDSITLFSKRLFAETRAISKSTQTNKHRYTDKGAIENPKERANGIDEFVRLSAYEDDKRIDTINNKLLSGSYATTAADYRTCMFNDDDPVDRYALPNDEKVQWAFYILPKSGDILQRGIVEPAYGHAGGGVEAYFEYGTSDGTYFNKKRYGDWSANSTKCTTHSAAASAS
ncbi:MAG: hypothetical protein LBJ57_07590, partial [Prevotellaceae bacterium]|nr:hypothetical protein [Prevotellaceae bacterium]